MADIQQKPRFFTLYDTWDCFAWCKILPQAVGTICPSFIKLTFFYKQSTF